MNMAAPLTHPMITVEEAEGRILSYFHELEAEPVPLTQAVDRVLAEDIIASINVPPHTNTAMDGYAVIAADTAGASRSQPRELRVIADLSAGYTTDLTITPGTAIRIMTGALIPSGADAIVPFEDTDEAETGRGRRTTVRIYKAARPGANIRQAGEDIRQGDLVLRRGTVLRPGEVGVIASLGKATVLVTRRPRVGILATGDELVEPGHSLNPGQIYNSNNYTIAAAVQRAGGIPLLLGIARDHLEDIRHHLHEGLGAGLDLLLTSAGVSVGEFDLVKQVLAAEGEIGLWRVRMKPGKPLAFGRLHGVPHLGLPGNPVSSLVVFELFARPAILLMQGKKRLHRPRIQAIFDDEVPGKDDRRHYLRVIVEEKADGYHCRLTGEQGSGILTSMVRANGLAIAPEEWTSVPRGARVEVIMLDWPEV